MDPYCLVPVSCSEYTPYTDGSKRVLRYQVVGVHVGSASIHIYIYIDTYIHTYVHMYVYMHIKKWRLLVPGGRCLLVVEPQDAQDPYQISGSSRQL